MQNSLPRKKANPLLLKLRSLRTPEEFHLLGAGFAKKNRDQMSAGTYKQNVTTAIILIILSSFVRKSYL